MNAESLLKKFSDKAELVEYKERSVKKEALLQTNKELKSFVKSSSEAYSVRTMVRGAWGFASTSKIKDLDSVFLKSYKLALNASANVKERLKIKDVQFVKDGTRTPVKEDAFGVSDDEKIRLLSDFNNFYSFKGIKNIDSSASFLWSKDVVLNSLGCEVVQEHVYSELFSTVVGGAKLESCTLLKRAKAGYELFKMFDLERSAKETGEQLKRLISGGTIKPGTYDLVIDPELSGTFFHEAVGHSLEADTLREKSTSLSLDEKVGPDFLTLYDDPTLPKHWGSYDYDDEGVKSKPSVLIKNGVISNFINDLNSFFSSESLAKTANGRSESPHFLPQPRMSNIVVQPGSFTKDELCSNVKNGLLVSGFVGGAVDTVTGVFSFKAEEAFKIANGKIAGNLKGVTLSGNLKKLLENISAVGKDSPDTLSGGFCGKKGQRVPVSEKVPYISVRGVTVGN